MADKRVLVTGGAGFIGSHLCKTLLNQGQEVICLDNYSTGAIANISDLVGHSRLKLINCDIADPMTLDGKIDEIYNLACPASPVHYQKDPVQTWKTNVLGVLNVLEIALSTKAKVLQASTSEVYGDPLINPQREGYWGNVNPIGVRSCYDEGKRCAETLCVDWQRQYGGDVKIVRIFNTYGPNLGLNDGRVVSNFILQALKNEPLTVYGDGLQTRSFCYVDDMIAGLMRMMDTQTGFIGPVNLGNPKEFTMLELAKKVIEQTGSSSQITFRELPPDDPRQRRPDISLAADRLGWEPKVSLEEGINRTIDDFRHRIFGDQPLAVSGGRL